MKVVVIGGSGHIGTYLIPKLVQAGHDVICVNRGISEPYKTSECWSMVQQVQMDRIQAERDGDFGIQIASLGGEVVIDLICFTPQSAQKLTEALEGTVNHFLHCGTMWVHGYSEKIPTTEDQKRNPFGSYGINKAAIETYLLDSHHKSGFPVSILHPGHITGPGWLPINPAGNLNPEIFVRLAKGEAITLPNLGMETVHHVHADDVAQAFMKAIDHRENSIGESFHVVSAQALTLRGYAEEMFRYFGHEPKLRFLYWDQWQEEVDERDKELTWDHIAHSPCGSIAKARKLLNYCPGYSSLQAVQEAIDHYLQNNRNLLDVLG
ncbi:MAG: NAD(P)-dependent oxidoreductase [Saprospiraceae bacterium]|nr:NAD(P)-dependent oxidoreductase [Saprospiraceae bacterium]